jgi:hypothetical protein
MGRLTMSAVQHMVDHAQLRGGEVVAVLSRHCSCRVSTGCKHRVVIDQLLAKVVRQRLAEEVPVRQTGTCGLVMAEMG